MQSVLKLKIFQSGILKKISFALLLFLTAVFYFFVPYIQNEYFFFRDDYQTQYMPAFYEIGRLLDSGEFPFISTRTLLGGNFAGEFQYAIFNPFSLLSYFILYKIIQSGAEFHQAAVFIPFIHTLIIIYFINSSLNVFRVSRTLKYFSVNVFLGSGTLVHWFYGNYIPGLMSLAWFSFFLYTILLFYSRSKWRILLPVSVFLTVASGWPLQVAAMGFVSGLFFLFLLIQKKRFTDSFLFSILVIAGLMISAPALMPVLEYGKTAVRSEWSIAASQWRINPFYFFQFSNPLFEGKFIWWDGLERVIHAPMLYVSIFFLPVIFIYIRSYYKYRQSFFGIRLHRRDLLLFLFSAFFVLICMSFLPNTNALRYLFRFLPPAVLIFSLWAGIFLSGRKSLISGLFFLSGSLYALYFFQLMILGKIKESLCILSLAILSFLFFKVGNRKFSEAFLSFIQITVYILSASYFTVPDAFIQLSEIRKKEIFKSQGYSVFIRGSYSDFKDTYLGNTALLYGFKSLNGYSPLVERKIFEYMCMDYFSRISCSDFSFLSAVDSVTGKTGADLFDLNFIQVQGKFETLETYLTGSEWKKEMTEREEKRYTRPRNQSFPEGISNLPAGMILKDLQISDNRISFVYRTSSEYKEHPLVFSRFFWKGYSAYSESAETPIIRVLDFFPGLVLSASDEYRQVKISYRPPGFSLSLSIASAGLIMIIFGSLTAKHCRDLRQFVWKLIV